MKKYLNVGILMLSGSIMFSCSSKSKENLTRVAEVSPVVHNRVNSINTPPSITREVEVQSLLLKRLDSKFNQEGVYSVTKEAVVERYINKIFNNIDAVSFREKLLGGLTLTPAVLQEASEEVERMPEGRRKEVLKIFLGRCIRNWRREATLSRMHDNKGGPRRYIVASALPPVYAYEGGNEAFPYEAAYKFRKGIRSQQEDWRAVYIDRAAKTNFEDFKNSVEREQKDNFYREQEKEIREKRREQQRREQQRREQQRQRQLREQQRQRQLQEQLQEQQEQ